MTHPHLPPRNSLPRRVGEGKIRPIHPHPPLPRKAREGWGRRAPRGNSCLSGGSRNHDHREAEIGCHHRWSRSGFVVEGAGERLVITAAHCLPSLPPAGPSFRLVARTFGPLLALRGEEPSAWAVCRFVDPIADIAVLGSPDNSHADDYIALMGTAADPPHKRPNCGVWSPQ